MVAEECKSWTILQLFTFYNTTKNRFNLFLPNWHQTAKGMTTISMMTIHWSNQLSLVVFKNSLHYFCD